MAPREVLVTTLDQIPVGEGRAFLVEGRQVALFHTHEGGIYATQAQCPHLNGPLADGLMGGTSLMCPLHDRTYDLKTGCGLTHERMSLEVYATRVDEGRIWVDPAGTRAAAQEPEVATSVA